MNKVETTQSNKKRNTEVTAKALLASDQLNYAAQQDKSQPAVKGKGTNSELNEKIAEDKEDSVNPANKGFIKWPSWWKTRNGKSKPKC